MSRRESNDALGVSTEEQADNFPMMSQGALELENRDLVARFQNELDDARLVETKMSEVSLGFAGRLCRVAQEMQPQMILRNLDASA